MKTLASWAPAPDLNVTAAEPGEQAWIVSVDGRDAEQRRAHCPVCGTQSNSRHSSYIRMLRDLSAQGKPVSVQVRSTRWRCRNHQCNRRIFAERLPKLATPFARRTTRLARIVNLFGHGAGGRPSERLMASLGMPVSDTTILRSVKKSSTAQPISTAVSVVDVDEWAWRKGTTFGMVIVDLERRQVVELLADRSAATTADWLKRHPEIEVVSRDRAGLYADAAREPSSLDQEAHAPPRLRTLDPMTGRQISPLTAAALCVKPRGQMTARQIINVDALKAASADFTTMRALAMRFRGLLAVVRWSGGISG